MHCTLAEKALGNVLLCDYGLLATFEEEKQKLVSIFSPACGLHRVWSALVNGQEAAKERKNGLLVRKVGALVYRYSAGAAAASGTQVLWYKGRYGCW